jgi:hypothetical protein
MEFPVDSNQTPPQTLLRQLRQIKVLWNCNIVLLFNAIRGAIIFICEMFCRSLAERKCKKKNDERF